jgi:hypothetical protein
MGTMTYASHVTFEFDDRVLAHVELAILIKLRRREAFLFSWRDGLLDGGGRTAVWIHPAVGLRFQYRERPPGPVDRRWVDALLASAASPGGMVLVAQPERGPAHQGDPVLTVDRTEYRRDP